MKCPKCEEPMKKVTMPQVIFSLGRYAIIDYEAKDYFCEECSREPELRFEEAMAESIGKQAYDEGFNDGRNCRDSVPTN